MFATHLGDGAEGAESIQSKGFISFQQFDRGCRSLMEAWIELGWQATPLDSFIGVIFGLNLSVKREKPRDAMDHRGLA